MNNFRGTRYCLKLHLLLLISVLLGFGSVSLAAPVGFSAWVEAGGPLTHSTITLKLQTGTADIGKNGQLFIAARLPSGQWYSLTGGGWAPSTTFPPFQQTTLGTHSIKLLTDMNITSLDGTAIYAGYGSDLQDMLSRQSYAMVYTVGGALGGAADAGDFLTFSINVQDFSYPELSASTVDRIITLHEQYKVPVDIYLTDTMLDIYQSTYPALMARLTTSFYVKLDYHIRPPKPYYQSYDWAGLSNLPVADQTTRIKTYESSVVDLTTGLPTSKAGGYKQLLTLPNTRPGIAAAFQVDDVFLDASAAAFKALGATWTLSHTGNVLNLGESDRGLYIRPEHYDLKLFELTSQSATTLIENAFTSGRQEPGARQPIFVGAKMHDNDFFAAQSAWLTVYVDGGKRPSWNPALKSGLKSSAEQAAQWKIYEDAVKYANSQRQRIGIASSAGIAQLRGSADAAGGAKLYISGTLHLETSFVNWPNVDELLSFFKRAVVAGKTGSQTTGMKWSIGADIGWLQNEARAGEVIRALAPLGVEFDVHAHNASDRVKVAEKIVQLGGTPTKVASGLLYTEIDDQRNEQVSSAGYRWQATTLWGLVLSDGHAAGADDTAAGVWRPRSSSDFRAHDPAGSLIAVGNGIRSLSEAENFAQQLATGAYVQPVYSFTINLTSKSLQVLNSTDGIAEIETWAARVGAMSNVRWATISGTADAFKSAGGLPSRINPD